MRTRVSLSIACILLVTASARAQTVWYVDDDGDTENGCTSWLDACPELQAALSLAGDGDQIWVAEGTYRPDYDVKTSQHTGDREASFHLISGVAIYGGFNGTETKLEKRTGLFDQTILTGDLNGDDGPNFKNNAENCYTIIRAVEVDHTAVVDGFTIRGGNADDYGFWFGRGAGLYCDRGSPTLRRCSFTQNVSEGGGGGAYLLRGSNASISECMFTDNRAGRGSGLACMISSPVISQCTFSDNTQSSYGGAIYAYGSSLTLTECVVINNTANQGGGLFFIGDGNPSILRCLITSNTSSGNGGGLVCRSLSSPKFSQCTITQNTGSRGGGVHCYQDASIFTNCTIAANTAATGSGGGVYVTSQSTSLFTNCTIAANTAARSVGGMYFNASNWSKPTVENSILWGNSGSQMGVFDQAEVVVRYSNVPGGWPGEGNINADPLWVNPAAQDFHLLPNSPCIDAGDPEYEAEEEEFDIDGEPGVFNDRIDIGADEYHDCNGNGVPDYLDIADGASEDCTANAIPDECEPDCNSNGVADSCDINDGTSEDCTADGILDECEPDCNNNGFADSCDVAAGSSEDCNANGIPDECIELENDCDSNGTPDECDTADGNSEDCDDNSIPDECEDTSADCNENGVWDACDLAVPASDADLDGALDECETLLLLLVDDDAPNDPGPGDPLVSDPAEDGGLEHPYDAIQEAIEAAMAIEDRDPRQNYLVEILMADGTYTGLGNKDIVFSARPYMLHSENGRTGCIIDCESNGRGFHFASGETPGTRLEGLTITHGSADDGGAIFCENSSHPEIDDCLLIANTSVFSGGGIACDSSSPTMTNCTICQNTTGSRGGGIACIFGSAPLIDSCTITDNISSSEGGGIHCRHSSHAKITNCTISHNTADSKAGGVGCWNTSNIEISNCILSNNVSGLSAGGVYNWKSHPKITNCAILNNTAEKHGGGLMFHVGYDSEVRNCLIANNQTVSSDGIHGGGIVCSSFFGLRIVNSTIAGNSSTADVGGVRGSGGSYFSIENSIIWNNAFAQIFTSNEIELTVRYSDIQGGEGAIVGNALLLISEGNIDADPLFVDPDGLDDKVGTEDDDLRLSPGSPCIDASANSAVPQDAAADLDGNPRFVDDPETGDTGLGECSIVDMGAYEFQDGTTCCPADFDDDGTVGAADLSMLLGSWGPCEGCPADLDGNGQVGPFDLALLLGSWGPCP